MKSILTIIFFGIIINLVKAQDLNNRQLDSLYNKFIQMREPSLSTKGIKGIQSIDTTYYKCTFGIVSEIKVNFNRFSAVQKAVLKPLLARPITDTSFVTPNGFFRVHYDVTGINVPRYNLDSLAIALDSAYNFEVNYLGYPPPPSDNGAGGDNKYDIYIIHQGDSYGYTEPDSEIGTGTNRYTSYMVIDNSFAGFYTTGINAARVTVAHEFHHSIQIGDYIYRYDLDEFFYELTSTSMEHFVYPSIHDYYQYLPAYFDNTQFSLGKNNGGRNQEYALAIWNIFLEENFGYGIIKKQWQLMPNMRALQAISNSLLDYNTTFREQFNKFGIWTYYTNYHAESGYFSSASEYPIIQPITTLQIVPPSKTVQISTYPVTNTFIRFVNPSNNDTLVSLITNFDITQGIDSVNNYLPFKYTLYANSGANFSYSEKFSAANQAFWIVSGFLNNKLFESGKYFITSNDFAFPSPFSYKKNSYIYIPVKPDASKSTYLNIYSSSMNLVYSRQQTISSPVNGKYVIVWNGLKNNGEKLPTGVYIYVTKSGGNKIIGKLVIIR